jgi:hypothetical protein
LWAAQKRKQEPQTSGGVCSVRLRRGHVGGFFLTRDINKEVVVFQVGIPSGVEKWKLEFPAFFREVGCDVGGDNEQTGLLFVGPKSLDLSEEFSSHAKFGFHRKFVLPTLCLYFDHCVELVAVMVDSLRLFPVDDLRGESGRALESL